MTVNLVHGTKGFPRKFSDKNYRLYIFSKEEFRAACLAVQGNCSRLINDPVRFISEREEHLKNYGGQYCDFGFIHADSVNTAWYETMSGTILFHSFTEIEKLSVSQYGCYLPNTQLGGHINTLLDMIQEGMTLEQYVDWYNVEKFPEERERYTDKMVFWNTKMVPLGYPQMESHDSHWAR